MRVEIHYDETELSHAHRVREWLKERSEQPGNVMCDVLVRMELEPVNLGHPKWGR